MSLFRNFSAAVLALGIVVPPAQADPNALQWQLKLGKRSAIVDCSKKGLERWRALDKSLHSYDPAYRPAFNEAAVRAHLMREGVSQKIQTYIETDCARRLAAQP